MFSLSPCLLVSLLFAADLNVGDPLSNCLLLKLVRLCTSVSAPKDSKIGKKKKKKMMAKESPLWGNTG